MQVLLAGVVTYIFYKIFANSLVVISEFDIKKAFTVEEVVGASLMLTIALCSLGDFAIFGFEVKTVLSILIVLILGWKKGILIGAASGITIGAVIGAVRKLRTIIPCDFCTIRNDSRIS